MSLDNCSRRAFAAVRALWGSYMIRASKIKSRIKEIFKNAKEEQKRPGREYGFLFVAYYSWVLPHAVSPPAVPI
jgi:hypothetical protein